MEETSFRAGAAAAAGLLTVAGGVIALAFTLGGNHAEAATPASRTAPLLAPRVAPWVAQHTPATPAPAGPSPSPAKPRPKPMHAAPVTGSQALPEEAAVYTPPPSPPGRRRGYRGRHRMPFGGWYPMGGSWGGFPHQGWYRGGPHFP